LGQVAQKLADDRAAGRSNLVMIGEKSEPKGDAEQKSATVRGDMKSAKGILEGYAEGIRAIHGEGAEERIRNMRIFVDNGALLKDQDPEQALLQVVEFCKVKIPDVKYVEHYDAAQKAFVLVDVKNPSNRKKILDPRNDRPKNPAELFTFLDAGRATGSDPLMMDNGVGVMTCDPTSTTLEGFLQGIMRERKFLSGQQMDIVTSDSIKDHVNATTCADLIGLFAKNSSKNILRQRIQATTLRIREMIATLIENKQISLAEKGNFDELEEFNKKYGKFLKTTDVFDVDKIFNDVMQEKAVREILTRNLERIVGELKK